MGEVEFLQADTATGKVARGWAAAQVATSADFAHGSWFWTHISGGLNYQVGTHTDSDYQSLPFKGQDGFIVEGDAEGA